MPYPNEHACRLENPDLFDRFTREKRKSESTGKTYSVIYGWRRVGGKEVSTVQAHRYPKGTWSADEARKHCRRYKGRFEAATQEFYVPDVDDCGCSE